MTRKTHGDGTTESFTFADSSGSGCGTCSGSGGNLIATHTDRDGIPTAYAYDGLGRQIESTRLGITQKTALDALGRATKVERIGTDDFTIMLSEKTWSVCICLQSELAGSRSR